jgi:hypothetical protein
MNEYKGVLIGFSAVLFCFLSAGIEYYKIANVAVIGTFLAFPVGIYGFIVHVRSMMKRFKSEAR